MSKTAEKKTIEMKTIEITNKEFLNRLSPAFGELSKVPSNENTGILKYAIKRSAGSFEDAYNRYNGKKTEIFEERCKLDGDGNPLFDENQSYKFPSKEKRKEAISLLEKLDKEVIKLTIFPITLSNLTKAIGNISIGLELNLGDFIIDDSVDAETNN